MKSKKSSKVNRAWIHDHVNDPWVKLAQKEGYLARAAYKLQEIDEVFHLFNHTHTVVDLGCTPGAWCQYVQRQFKKKSVADDRSLLVGVDLLEMDPIEGVTFIQGDFREETTLRQLEACLQGRTVDVVLSDMAPNLSGVSDVDHAKMEYLMEITVDFAQHHLCPSGMLVAKVFHGKSYNAIVGLFKDNFVSMKACKPKASRDRSAETYLVGVALR